MYPANQKKKKIHPLLAVALKHDRGEDAPPYVVASGQGLLAEQMLEIARAEDIPIHKDETMAQLLGELELNQHIPRELFDGVAKVLAFIYNIDKRVESV